QLSGLSLEQRLGRRHLDEASLDLDELALLLLVAVLEDLAWILGIVERGAELALREEDGASEEPHLDHLRVRPTGAWRGASRRRPSSDSSEISRSWKVASVICARPYEPVFVVTSGRAIDGVRVSPRLARASAAERL